MAFYEKRQKSFLCGHWFWRAGIAKLGFSLMSDGAGLPQLIDSINASMHRVGAMLQFKIWVGDTGV